MKTDVTLPLEAPQAEATPEAEAKKRVAQLLKQAKGKDQDAVSRAYDEIVQLGCKLERADVDQISAIMRKGGRTWREFLYRESHCQWFAWTRASYYAANALIKIEAAQVSEALRAEAQKVRGDAKGRERVTDPGWI